MVQATVAAEMEGMPTPPSGPDDEDVRQAVREGILAYNAARPTPTPAPTLAQIEALLEDRIGDAIANMPPASNSGPTASRIQEMIDDSIADAITSLSPGSDEGPTLEQIQELVAKEVQTAVSQAPSLAVTSQSSASSRTTLADGISITIHPGKPIAGRDVKFTLDGLEPWTRVDVEFVDPRNEPAAWVTDYEISFQSQGVPITVETLYADQSGALSWQRIATKDVEGVWTVRLDIDGAQHSVTYPVSQLQLSGETVEFGGLEMRRYQGIASDSYIASLVPASLAVDLQAHLAWVVRRLQEDYGLRSTQIPDIYLVGDRNNLGTVAAAVGDRIGFESGFYRSTGKRPGIYMTTETHRSGIERLLTHEYVHLVVAELTNNHRMPAWLNEGLAEYLEFHLGVESERSSATRLRTYQELDEVKSAELSGLGLNLTQLESQATWNAQTNPNAIGLQYGKSHMAVSYIIQEFSADAPIQLIRHIASGMPLSRAVEEHLDITYEELRNRIDLWISEWTDPEREEVRTYTEIMDSIYAAVERQVDRRNEILNSNMRPTERVSVLDDIVNQVIDIRLNLNGVTTPQTAKTLHEEFGAWVDTVTEWLTLERNYASTGRDSNRTAANALIPEADARRTQVRRALGDLKYIYQVGRY